MKWCKVISNFYKKVLLEQLNYIFSKVFNAEQMYFSHLKKWDQ